MKFHENPFHVNDTLFEEVVSWTLYCDKTDNVRTVSFLAQNQHFMAYLQSKIHTIWNIGNQKACTVHFTAFNSLRPRDAYMRR